MGKLIVTMRVLKRTKKEKKPNLKRTNEYLPNPGKELQVTTMCIKLLALLNFRVLHEPCDSYTRGFQPMWRFVLKHSQPRTFSGSPVHFYCV